MGMKCKIDKYTTHKQTNIHILVNFGSNCRFNFLRNKMNLRQYLDKFNHIYLWNCIVKMKGEKNFLTSSINIT